MSSSLSEQPAHLRLLFEVLAEPGRCLHVDEAALDLLIRTARAARLLGVVSARIRGVGAWVALPERARVLLEAADVEARYCRQMMAFEMASVADVLAPHGIPMILLKGAAYVAQELPVADGRLPRDLDLLVPRERLGQAERLLLGQGWQFDPTLTSYDQHYYRAWSHELPPLRQPTHAFEVDVHHSILPPIGRLRPDIARMIARTRPLPNGPYRVLQPEDQLLHAVVHLFQDSDCAGRLRDLLDIDGLARHFAVSMGEVFWDDVLRSAAFHGLGRPLWYALSFSRSWLRTPLPDGVATELERLAPPVPLQMLMVALVRRAMPPVHPDAEPGWSDRIAQKALEFRSVWLRMPPWTLAYHGAHKLLRRRGVRGAPTPAP